VNGMGPFSLLGSSDDSEASCQPEVQDCKPCLLLSVVWKVVANAGGTHSNFLTSSTGSVAVLLITGRLKSRTMCILWINPWRRT
jgi:hypothetical protein